MNQHTRIRAENTPDIHAIWDAEDDALPTLEQRAARLKAALESPRHQALQKAIDERAEREAVRLQARADAEFAELSKQFLRMAGIEEPKVLRGRS
jgi:hypothetical protein